MHALGCTYYYFLPIDRGMYWYCKIHNFLPPPLWVWMLQAYEQGGQRTRTGIFLSVSLFLSPLCTPIVPLSRLIAHFKYVFSSVCGGRGIGGCNSHENGLSLPGPQGPTRFELHLVVAAHVAVHSFLLPSLAPSRSMATVEGEPSRALQLLGPEGPT